ncbi:MAG: hypothetical protein GF331_01870 [Chitinivibrionales bacterium]|nr:hypothetical protein [Chitinivibrionales bacterium]
MKTVVLVAVTMSALLWAGGCSNAKMVTPCTDARTLREQARATADGHERAVLNAKADAAEELCRRQANKNAERAFEAEQRHHREDAMERGE